MISDQELAGLDILTNGDYHLDFDLAGRSWFSYPSERLSGMTEFDTETTAGWSYPVGTWLNEIVGGWKYHGDRGQDRPARAARVREGLAGRAGADGEAGEVRDDLRRPRLDRAHAPARTHTTMTSGELMWDLATVLNAELRQLVAAGCKVVQIEEPAIHSAAAWGADEETLDFYVDLFNFTVEGLDEAEVWVHTCWGNPGAQHCFDPNISYEPSLEIYMDRLKADVWTIESKDNGHRLLPSFGRYKGKLDKKIAVGFISHRALQVETAEEVAADVRHGAGVHRRRASSSSRRTAGSGARACRGRSRSTRPRRSRRARTSSAGELGAPTTTVRAAEPGLQMDVPASVEALAT